MGFHHKTTLKINATIIITNNAIYVLMLELAWPIKLSILDNVFYARALVLSNPVLSFDMTSSSDLI